ncbi:rhomboid family intramembrane serine protease [Waterburya agarophytonicola K14]|uniref:Rhomboid family intramembrane serine protease n=1 Tax=Waterburya agarophytonicola KI4 TaxID=2874699 RepID=A0A964BTS5_9CYAN|nr:rhomboid family intramembrane serine protease [Waterburya agarophytonicola]MCC0178567.1 rhomboid family intramembrane serine protease [Waterburya agarophytonicola KI4]
MRQSDRQVGIAYTTYILIALNLLVYALEIKFGGSQNSIALERLGALIPEKVWAGEWWRLIGANFLHYGSFHLATNMLSLFFIGRLIELSLGAKYYLTIYLVSGIGSMLTFSLLAFQLGLSNVFLVGASAAIMGLIGAILAISLQIWLRKRYSLTAKRRLQQVILIIIIQFIFDNIIPQVSFHSHLFGFIIGFLISSVLVFIKFKMKEVQ